MARHPTRSIRRLLVANRGEIAVRILNAARERGIETYAVYTDDDRSHASRAAKAVRLRGPASYLDIAELIQLVKDHQIDAVHPGYGFLSESADFARQMWEQADCMVIGPGPEILEVTGSKLEAKKLARECDVPTLPALMEPTDNLDALRDFASQVGYPIMVKAVDGGGGRGIRLIRSEDQLSLAKRAIEESPSKQVFAERAAVENFRHVEVQIIGDCHGTIEDLWERECSIQRRYQKIVEFAPSTLQNRELAGAVVKAAVRMAEKVNYFSLGTFEFLVNPDTSEWYFLEINPRLQVEHTVSEEVARGDLVDAQLLLAQGHQLHETGLLPLSRSRHNRLSMPELRSIQLRVTAENVYADWSLSIGKITSFSLPSGPGIRVDTHLANGTPTIVGPAFDSLIAKIIVTSTSWPKVVRKAARALEDIQISGVKTNLDILRGIVGHDDFMRGRCDTGWLEAKQAELFKSGAAIARRTRPALEGFETSSEYSTAVASAASMLFRKGDAWSITLSPTDTTKTKVDVPAAHLAIQKVLRNEFPASLAAEIRYTPAGSSDTTQYALHLKSTTASAGATTATHRKGEPRNPRHVVIPYSGKLVEVLVEEGDIVKEGDVICVVQQMKMELEIRAAKAGRVVWVIEAEDGDDVGEGALAAELELLEERPVQSKI